MGRQMVSTTYNNNNNNNNNKTERPISEVREEDAGINR